MTTQTSPDAGGPSSSDMPNTNVASGNVDAQIGVVQGDAVFHRHESIYQFSRSDPPERKYRVALNRLEGGTPRVAEELIGEVLKADHKSTETTKIAYHYVLAILSDRSLNQLSSKEFDNIKFALHTANQFPVDEWRAALDVIARLMECVVRQERHGDPDPEELQSVLDAFQHLPTPRQTEITRHLDMILNGAVQDVLDAVNAEIVANERMGGKRDERAWKFFQPNPAPPRRAEPHRPLVSSELWVKAVLGGIGLRLGLLFAFGFLVQDPVRAGVCLVLCLGGGFLAVRYRLERALVEERRLAKESEHGGNFPTVDDAPVDDRQVPDWFVRGSVNLGEAHFRDQRPRTPGSWDNDVAGVKETLMARFIPLYSPPAVDPPAALNWLIRWHAERVAAQWRSGTLSGFRQTLRPSVLVNGLYGLGVVLAATGVLGLITAATGTAFTAGLFLAVGGYFAVLGGLEIMVGYRRYAEVKVECDQLFQEEQRAYQAWMGVLQDRPTDDEMARWLDFDTFHLKTTAMRHSGLTNRDIIAHVVLTEGMPLAMRARVLHGPVRYSAYHVLVFLLTDGGVREIELDLDFLTGTVHDERRTSFRYDALASARVAEVSVQFAGNRRQVVLANNNVRVTHDHTALVFSQALWLSLVNGQEITVLVENFDGLTDAAETKSYLTRLALDASGVASALHILEAVAAEGREWIQRERERRERRLQDWSRGKGTLALDSAAGLLELPPTAPFPDGRDKSGEEDGVDGSPFEQGGTW